MTAQPPPWTDPDTGEVWQREGECSFCGACCRTGDPYSGDPSVSCRNLIERPDGTGICGVHGSADAYWFNACRVFPQFPAQLATYPRCTFRFTRVDGDG